MDHSGKLVGRADDDGIPPGYVPVGNGTYVYFWDTRVSPPSVHPRTHAPMNLIPQNFSAQTHPRPPKSKLKN